MPLLDFLQSIGLGFADRPVGRRASAPRPNRSSLYGLSPLIDTSSFSIVYPQGGGAFLASPFTRNELLAGINGRLPNNIYYGGSNKYFRIQDNTISNLFVNGGYPETYTNLPGRTPVRPTTLMSESDDDGE